MLALDVTLDTTTAVSPEFAANFYWNVDSRGIASGAVDEGDAINESPIALFYGAQDVAVWQDRRWLSDVWLADVATPNLRYTTSHVHFGAVLLAAKSVDAAGNEQDGAIAETTTVVNSTPYPPTGLRRGDWDEVAETQAFTFRQSSQLVGS